MKPYILLQVAQWVVMEDEIQYICKKKGLTCQAANPGLEGRYFFF